MKKIKKERIVEVKNLLHLKHIPSDIKDKFKLLGRGVTSIAFDKNENKILLLTMDDIKVEWLLKTGLGRHIKSFDVPSLRKFGELHLLEVKKLKPLSRENLTTARKFINEFRKKSNQILYDMAEKAGVPFWSAPRAMKTEADYKALKILAEKYDDKFMIVSPHNVNMVDFLADWIINYGDMLNLDFHKHNFMEDEKGRIVIIDPVISEEYFRMIL